MNYQANSFKITTICGSMQFYDEMLKAASDLTTDGYIVLMPFVSKYKGGKESDKLKEMLDKMHRAKIDLSSSITVIGWDRHMGESTKDEIEHAKFTKKDIFLYKGV